MTVYLCGGQYEYQDHREVLMAEVMDLPLERMRGKNLLPMSVNVSEILRRF